MSLEFTSFPKVPRLVKPMVLTEKIDGTNGQIVFINQEDITSEQDQVRADKFSIKVLDFGREKVYVLAGSRNKYLKVTDDNFRFAHWVHSYAQELFDALGEGRHYGEWFGKRIQRGYGLDAQYFALFNVGRYGYYGYCPKAEDFYGVPGLTVVPTLYQGEFNLGTVEAVHADLMETGSRAAAGFDRPEGVMVFHEAARQLFKYTGDNSPKSLRETPGKTGNTPWENVLIYMPDSQEKP